VGPDALVDHPEKGPKGYDEFNLAKAPGNYGWPHFVGNNFAYNRWDFVNWQTGPTFNSTQPKNESPNIVPSPQFLPPAQGSLLWYSYQGNENFADFSGPRTAIAGPVYHYNGTGLSQNRLPSYFDKKWFIGEQQQGWIKVMTLDELGESVVNVEPFLPTVGFKNPIDIEIGLDGMLYVLEFGGGGYTSVPRPDAGLFRIEYIAQNPECLPVLGIKNQMNLGEKWKHTQIGRVVNPLIKQNILLPEHFERLEIFDIKGTKLWEFHRNTEKGTLRVSIPIMEKKVWFYKLMGNKKN